MGVLLNEPEAIYAQSTTKFESKRSFSFPTDSSIFLSKGTVLSDEVAEMNLKLNRLASLTQNWDSYQADAPSHIAITRAQSFLKQNHFLDLPFYFLAPGVNGEVMIEFKKGIHAAELYFLADGADELILFEDDEVKFEGTLSNDFRKLISFFNP